jgi:hypothetical protein
VFALVFASAVSEPFSVSLSDAALLASLAILPGLFVGYVLYLIRAHKMKGNFYLARLEQIELDRAVLLYEKVFSRRREIFGEGEHDRPTLLARCRRRYKLKRRFAGELEELEAYGRHLRATIVRLRCKPIHRFKSFVHIVCSRFALSHSLGSYFLTVALISVGFHLSEQPAWAADRQASLAALLLSSPLDDRLLYAHVMATGVVAVAMPLLYFFRRAELYSDHAMQFRILQEFADTDPETLIYQPRADRDWYEESPQAAGEDADEEGPWFEVLGLSPSATIEEVKEAYRERLKQNHPDRVHGMSPLFRALAEAETKKLNVAYEEALAALRAA